MKHIAVIFAGGTGQRMNLKTIPKQFLNLYGKPILCYTLDQFQMHEDIDAIIIVMLEKWIDYTNELIRKYNYTKVVKVVPGGETGQQSIYNGLIAASEMFDGKDIVVIHDGVRPLVDEETIHNAVSSAETNGSGVTVAPVIETIVMCNGRNEVETTIDRSICKHAKAPQCFRLGEIMDAHEKAKKETKNDFIDSASIMHFYGYTIHTVEGNPENIKITTPSDYYIFKALMDARENSMILGL